MHVYVTVCRIYIYITISMYNLCVANLYFPNVNRRVFIFIFFIFLFLMIFHVSAINRISLYTRVMRQCITFLVLVMNLVLM